LAVGWRQALGAWGWDGSGRYGPEPGVFWRGKRVRAAMVIGVSIILIITSLVMVLLVLLHKGKGGGLSDMFGGGVSSTLGSSSVVERNLDRITIFFGILWFVCIIGLNLLIIH
jgi:preprotein translocase subunit SecG